MTSVIEFITIPTHSPGSVYQKFLDAINSEDFEVLYGDIDHSFSLGRVKHKYIIKKTGNTGMPLTDLQDMSVAMSMVSLTLRIRLTTKQYEDASYIRLGKVVTAYLSKRLGLPSNELSCDMNISNLSLIITPRHNGELLYMFPEEKHGIQNSLKLKDYMSKIVLGSDHRLLFVIRSHFTEDIAIKDIYYDELIDAYVTEQIILPHMIKDIYEVLMGYIDKGYKCITYSDNSQLSFYKSFLSLWDGEVIEINNNVIIFRSRGYIPDVSDVHHLSHTSMPFFITLGGEWQENLPLTNDSAAKIYYIVQMEMANDPYLAPNYEYVNVAPDLSVNIPVFSNIQAKQIHNVIMEKYRDNYDIIYAKDMLDAVSIRLYCESPSLIVSFDDNLYVVSQKKSTSTNGISTGSIRERFMDFLTRTCDGLEDPVSLDNFNDLDTLDLLQVIRPEKDSRYCFTENTLSRLPNKISPVTREPFNDRIVKLIDDPLMAVKGFIDLGDIISGIHKQPPIYPEVNVDIPLEITRLDKVTTYEAVFSDGKRQEFTTVNTDVDSLDSDLLIQKWKKGQYLAPWSRYIIQRTELTPYPLMFSGDLGWLGRGSPLDVSKFIDEIRKR
jgi:hypothetical protein